MTWDKLVDRCLLFTDAPGGLLKELLKEALQYKINETKRINYLFHLFKNHLLEGYITDRNLPAAKTIANYLSKEFNS